MRTLQRLATWVRSNSVIRVDHSLSIRAREYANTNARITGEWDDVEDCIEIDECADMPCANGGTCVDAVNGFSCQCAADYYGMTCSETHNDCTGDEFELCGHGTCIDLERTNESLAYSCTCDDGWSKYEGEEECTSENTCDVFVFTEGMIGDTSNNDACSDRIVLTAVNDNSCDLACKEGYKSSGM